MVRSLAMCFVVFAPYIALTWAGLVSAARARHVLRTHPWRAYGCSFGPTGEHQYGGLVVELDDGHSVVVVPAGLPTEINTAHDRQAGRVWLAGDPLTGGVASPVGGHRPVRVVRRRARERDLGVHSPDVRADMPRRADDRATAHPR